MSELVWAAGFYDGEGCTDVMTANRRLRLQISQVRREPLERFLNAVGLGKIYGPYSSSRTGNSVPIHMYHAYGSAAEKVIEMIYCYLSIPKLEQIDHALDRLNSLSKNVQED